MGSAGGSLRPTPDAGPGVRPGPGAAAPSRRTPARSGPAPGGSPDTADVRPEAKNAQWALALPAPPGLETTAGLLVNQGRERAVHGWRWPLPGMGEDPARPSWELGSGIGTIHPRHRTAASLAEQQRRTPGKWFPSGTARYRMRRVRWGYGPVLHARWQPANLRGRRPLAALVGPGQRRRTRILAPWPNPDHRLCA